jgi:hypothetical protein
MNQWYCLDRFVLWSDQKQRSRGSDRYNTPHSLGNYARAFICYYKINTEIKPVWEKGIQI